MGKVKEIRTEGYYQIAIIFPDGKKIVKQRCNLKELFKTYFINLDKLRSPEDTAESLLQKYKDTYINKGIKVGINYIDSRGHKWIGKCAWPRESKFITYLNEV